jgi:hypothetical protein
MPSNADVVSLQMEKVRKKLSELFETSNVASNLVQRGAETEQISTRDYRIPFIYQRGGKYRTFNPDGGDMGRGSGPKATHMVATYFPVVYAIELTNLEMYATATSEKAVKKAFAYALTNAMKEFQVYTDYSFHTAGDGIFARPTSHSVVSSKSVYTLDTAFATQLCRRGMGCTVYQNNLSAARVGATDSLAPRTIEKVDIGQNQITLDQEVASAGNDDFILFEGVSGATPAWKNGLYKFNNSSTSGSLLSVVKADYPEIVAQEQPANGALNGVFGMLLLDELRQKRDDEVISGIIGLAHSKQRTAWYKAGMTISEWQRGSKDKMIDLVPDMSERNFMYAGVKHTIDKHQNRTRIDWFNPKIFGRAILKELDWHTVEGRKLFELRGASGGVAAGMVFYLEQLEDWYSTDPGAGGYISGLTLPTA